MLHDDRHTWSPAVRLRRIERAARGVRLAVFLAALALLGAHLAVTYAVEERIDPLIAGSDGVLALITFLAALLHIGGLTRERRRHALVETLATTLTVPRDIDGAARVSVDLPVAAGIADAALLAVTRTPDPDGPDVFVPIAASGYPSRWLERAMPLPAFPGDQPQLFAARMSAEDDQPWLTPLHPALGKRPWVAQLPIERGGELLGVLVLARAKRSDALTDRSLLLTLSALIANALEHARLYQAGHDERRGLMEQESRRREFLYATAHELRTPLTSIQTFAELLQADAATGGVDEAGAMLLASLSRGVDRLRALVDDLLDLGQMEETDIRLDVRPIDLAEPLRHAEEMLRPSFMARGQAFTVELPAHPLVVLADGRAVEQVALNLLSNAHRFTPAGGAITLRAAAHGADVVIEVEDEGPGIDTADRIRIFEPFYRVRRPDAPNVPGSGLGLAIARRMVVAQGGRIWVEPAEVGTGCRFCFELPLLATGVDALPEPGREPELSVPERTIDAPGLMPPPGQTISDSVSPPGGLAGLPSIDWFDVPDRRD